MAIRSEGGKRTQYVLLRAEGRGEVEVIQDADALLRRAIAENRITLPPGMTYRWVGRYEQQVKAAKPTFDYDPVYGSTTGFWTTDRFIEAAYKSLSEPPKDAQ